jgi:ATP adenylyltransferase
MDRMSHIWSPWRKEYIENQERPAGCIFCNEVKKVDGPENLVVYRGERVYVILNRYPYTSGHLMVVPFAHLASLELMDTPTRSELIDLISHSTVVLNAVYGPAGFNIGANVGASAGAGIADHFHMHLVPRWSGDTNFMSTVSGTRVISAALEDIYQRVCAAWKTA